MSEPTETVVVRDANIAHTLIGRSIGGQAVAFFTASDIEVRFFTLGQDDITGYRRWGEAVVVDALPPATMWVYLDDLPGHTLPGERYSVAHGSIRQNPVSHEWEWLPNDGVAHQTLTIVDHMVEVLAPVPVVEAPDEVTVREAAEALVGLYSPLDFTEDRVRVPWENLVSALAAESATPDTSPDVA